jgi:hypothetical protein
MGKANLAVLENPKTKKVSITAPNLLTLSLKLTGTSPYVQLRFSEKARNQMREKMELGESAKKNRKREPRQFAQEFEQAMYSLPGGDRGIPAAAFRNAAIDACRMAGFEMVKAKMSIFVISDGLDIDEGIPLVKITHGEPQRFESTVRNATGVADIRTRAMWKEWGVDLRVRFDADQFTPTDIINLFMRAGMQVGVGEGRPFTKKSTGMGFGLFDVHPEMELTKDKKKK